MSDEAGATAALAQAVRPDKPEVTAPTMSTDQRPRPAGVAMGNAATIRAAPPPSTAVSPAAQAGGTHDGAAAAHKSDGDGDFSAGFGGGGGSGGGGAGRSWSPDPGVGQASPTPGGTSTGALALPAHGSSAVGASSSAPPQATGRPAFDQEFDDIRLFKARDWERALFDRSFTRHLWRGKIPLGDFGFIAVDVTGRLRAEAALLWGIGPGLIRRIRLSADRGAGRASGTAELFIPGYVGPQLILGGSLHAEASYLGALPLVKLEGGLVGMARASAVGALMVPVTLSYEAGAITLVTAAELGLGPYLAFDLDAWLAASLLGKERARRTWRLVDWRWGTAWRLGARLTLVYRDGKLQPIVVDFYAAPLPIEDILPPALSAAAQDQAVSDTAAALTASAEVPMLSEATVAAAKQAIATGAHAKALRIVVAELETTGVTDASKYTIKYDPTGHGDGLTETNYVRDPTSGRFMPKGPSVVSIYPAGFQSVSWLASTIMHEYQHVVHDQLPQTKEEMADQTGEYREGDETEAYLWEIEHSDETGVRVSEAAMRDLGRRLTSHYNALGKANPARQKQYRERYMRAMDVVRAVAALVAATPSSPAIGPFATTPDGEITVRKGPLAGRTIKYGDSRAKHTKVAEYPMATLKEAIRDPTRFSGMRRAFGEAFGAKDVPAAWGSQLGAEGRNGYEALIRHAVEDGTQGGTNFYAEANVEIGFDRDLPRGRRAVSKYAVYGLTAGGGGVAHIIPEDW